MGGIKGNYYLRGELLVLLEGFENLLVLRIILRTSALSPGCSEHLLLLWFSFFFFFGFLQKISSGLSHSGDDGDSF